MSSANRVIPPVLDGFEGINRSWEPVLRQPCARIMPGEFYVTPHDEAIMTVLGSCISACVRDPNLYVGGMNHFMLPKDKGAMAEVEAGTEARYGTFAMERLVNELIKRGAKRDKLEVKIVGGGRMYESKADIGKHNIDFVLSYLQQEGLTIISQDLGGESPRRVQYFPRSGRLRVKRLPTMQMASVEQTEKAHLDKISERPAAGEIELF